MKQLSQSDEIWTEKDVGLKKRSNINYQIFIFSRSSESVAPVRRSLLKDSYLFIFIAKLFFFQAILLFFF